MFGLSTNETFILGVGSLWVFSAAVSSLPTPTTTSSAGYQWAYKFLKTIAGDLGSTFGKYIPAPTATPDQATKTDNK